MVVIDLNGSKMTDYNNVTMFISQWQGAKDDHNGLDCM